jgi:hypothetical protein
MKKNQVFQRNLVYCIISWMLLVLSMSGCGRAASRGWQYQSSSALVEVALPEGTAPSFDTNAADLDGDGGVDYVCLTESIARIQDVPCENESAAPRWVSAEEWQVAQVGLADLDSSGLPEVSLLVWRPFEPWPIDTVVPNPGRIEAHQNANGMSCHIILIGWQEGGFRELWAGSALADPLLAMVSADLDGDNSAELAALESDYDAPGGRPARALTVWGWNGFGFDLLARAAGRFHHLAVYEMPDGVIYLVTE